MARTKKTAFGLIGTTLLATSAAVAAPLAANATPLDHPAPSSDALAFSVEAATGAAGSLQQRIVITNTSDDNVVLGGTWDAQAIAADGTTVDADADVVGSAAEKQVSLDPGQSAFLSVQGLAEGAGGLDTVPVDDLVLELPGGDTAQVPVDLNGVTDQDWLLIGDLDKA